MKGDHFDHGKPRVELIPEYPLLVVGDVLAYGARKYEQDDGSPLQDSEYNWRKGITYLKLIGSILRHIIAFKRREDLDRESGLPHLGHAVADLMMLMDMTHMHPELDDRWLPEEELQRRLKAGEPVVRLAKKSKKDTKAYAGHCRYCTDGNPRVTSSDRGEFFVHHYSGVVYLCANQPPC